jgi:hypothetical protein
VREGEKEMVKPDFGYFLSFGASSLLSTPFRPLISLDPLSLYPV